MSQMLQFYGLREHPFGVSPNPRFLYPTPQHREALASLIYGIENRVGFAALIAEPGSGKTTLLFDVLLRFRDRASTAFVFNTQCSGLELLRHIVMELQIPRGELEQDPIKLYQIFTSFVADRQRTKPVLIVIDEAQNLQDSALETLRLLSNFEAAESKLLHIILAGQPEFAEKLQTKPLAPLLQRITTISRLNRLSLEQTEECIAFRLRTAGYSGPPLFSNEAMARIKEASGGVPREINRICINALQIGFALRERKIDIRIIEEVLSDLDLTSEPCLRVPGAPPHANPRPTAPQPTQAVPETPAAAEFNFSAERLAQVPPTPLPIAEAEPIPDVPPPEVRMEAQGVRVSLPPVAPPTALPFAGAAPRVSKVAFDENPKGSLTPLASEQQENALKEVRKHEEPKIEIGKHKVEPGIRTAVLTIPLVGAAVAALALLVMSGTLHLPFSPIADTSSRVSQIADEQKAEQSAPDSAVSNTTTQSANSTSSNGTDPRPVNRETRQFKRPVALVLPNTKNRLRGARETPPETEQPLPRPLAPLPKQPTPSLPVVRGTTAGNDAVPSIPFDRSDVIPGRRETRQAASPSAMAMPNNPALTTSAPAQLKTTDERKAVLKKFVRPVYPERAKAMHLQGDVSLQVNISGAGSVQGIRVLSGNPVLARAAQDAVQQWQYQSPLVNGAPVPTQERIVVTFHDNP